MCFCYSGDRFAWLRDNEFGRQALAGVNPVNIELLKVCFILPFLNQELSVRVSENSVFFLTGAANKKQA